VHYYMQELIGSKALARRIASLAQSQDAKGAPGGRLAFRLESRLLGDALDAAKQVHMKDKSALVRGILLGAKQDAYDAPDAERRTMLRAIAVATGA
jgi:hypothetical protein